jgi:hypothetical protein
MRWLFLAGLSTMAFAQALTPAETAELARATKNPFELARFIDTHPAPGWDIAWNAVSHRLTVNPTNWGTGCETEMITEATPQQVILFVKCAAFEDYVRYMRGPDDTWRCEGMTGSFKYPSEHRIDRSSGIPFLRMTETGDHGSGVDEQSESWFDLSRPGFEPVLRFDAKGWEDPMMRGIGRKISSEVDAAAKNEVHLALNVEFSARTDNVDIAIESRSLKIKFARVETSRRFRCVSVSAGLTCADLAALSDFSEEGPPREVLLRLCLVGLKRIATGPNGTPKQWLREYLAQRKNTPEVRELRALLK